jgi:hypothetical protein
VKLGHYTNTQGLLGIYQGKTLRATNIKFLNDEHEFIHALELIKRLITETDENKAAPYIDAFNEFRERTLSKITLLDQNTSESIFTLSFSEKTDLLSQWRGYCPSNDGYCLVIETDNIKESADHDFDECYFFKCIYNNDEKERHLKDILNECWAKYRKGSDKIKGESVEELRKNILLLASHFKHPAFEEESEHRIVVLLNFMPDDRVKFRQGRFSIIPYIDIKIENIETIKKIIIGPTHRKDLAERGLKSFLETTLDLPYLLIETGIEKSEIPYRS